jgi:O-antigen chain-terminating methyltransferase
MDDRIESMKRKIKDERRGRIDPVPSLDEVASAPEGKSSGEAGENGPSGTIDRSEHLKYLNEHHALQPEEIMAGAGRGALIKRWISPLVRSVTGNLTARWNAFTAVLVRFLNEVAERLNRHEHQMRAMNDRIEESRGQLAERMDLLYGKSEGNLTDMEMAVARFRSDLQQCIDRLDAFRETHALQGIRLKEILADLSKDKKRKAPLTPGQADHYLARLVSEDYYHFERLFREKSDHLMEKFKAYAPFFEGCKKVLDLGCGRGEFLTLMAGKGIPAYGLDSNAAMVETCRGKGLDVREQDVIEHLRSMKTGHVDGLFAAQLVEHLPADALREFIALACDRLPEGGKLLVETINPASVYALSRTFYLDFTHVRPVSPEGLKFLLEAAGCRRAEIRLISPVPEEVTLRKLPVERVKDRDELSFISAYNQNIDRLNSLLYGYQEYAVLAEKGGERAGS